MLKQRYGMGLAVAAMATAVACQPYLPSASPTGGELTMQVGWPMRILAIPPTTAVVAVGVFRADGSLVSKGSFQVGIVGRGAGAIYYGGLPNGDYRVVAGAYDREARPLAGGAGNGTINLESSPRTRVALSLQPGDPAAELNPFLPDIQRYLAGLPPVEVTPSPTATPTGTMTGDPNAVIQPTSTATPGSTPTPTSDPTPTPTPTATATTGAGSTSSGGTTSSTTTTVTFTGGFQ